MFQKGTGQNLETRPKPWMGSVGSWPSAKVLESQILAPPGLTVFQADSIHTSVVFLLPKARARLKDSARKGEAELLQAPTVVSARPSLCGNVSHSEEAALPRGHQLRQGSKEGGEERSHQDSWEKVSQGTEGRFPGSGGPILRAEPVKTHRYG